MENVKKLEEIKLVTEIETGEWQRKVNLKSKIEKFQNIAKELSQKNNE
jgi:hypothetical protein